MGGISQIHFRIDIVVIFDGGLSVLPNYDLLQILNRQFQRVFSFAVLIKTIGMQQKIFTFACFF